MHIRKKQLYVQIFSSISDVDKGHVQCFSPAKAQCWSKNFSSDSQLLFSDCENANLVAKGERESVCGGWAGPGSF